MSRYNVIDIANYVVSKSQEYESPITNLQLQKILYFLWIKYYVETGYELFDENFFAWQLGPVIPQIYMEYRDYGSQPICNVQAKPIISKDENILNPLIKKYSLTSTYDLVEQSHISGGAWDTIYRKGRGDRYLIPFSLIKEKCR